MSYMTKQTNSYISFSSYCVAN